MRPHGIGHTSFLIYTHDLRVSVTTLYLDFSVVCHLIYYTRLSITFLSYVFKPVFLEEKDQKRQWNVKMGYFLRVLREPSPQLLS